MILGCDFIIMAHRHIFGSSSMIENEQDQNWNHIHPEQSFVHLGNETLDILLSKVFSIFCDL